MPEHERVDSHWHRDRRLHCRGGGMCFRTPDGNGPMSTARCQTIPTAC